MLGIWMFGVELERMWGTKFFLQYYAITGVGAAITTMLVASAALRARPRQPTRSITIGASGALYGSCSALCVVLPGSSDPDVHAVPDSGEILRHHHWRDFVSAVAAPAAARSRTRAHLGGIIFGYLYLKGGRGGLTAEIKYRYLKWKMNRLRRKFDVYSGGRSDWDRKVH